jgi:hypothetical protein
MQKRFPLLAVALIALMIFAGLALATQEAGKPDAKMDKTKCLACHGPFEKLVKADIKFKTPADETVNPHKYVPHDSQDAPECTECHVPHQIPPPDKAAVQKPKDVQFCYDSCHHMKNLQSCKSCH